MRARISGILFLLATLFGAPSVYAAGEIPQCAATDHPCLMRQIETLVPSIEKQDWRDQTLRELAKTYAYEGQEEKAIALIARIENPDTKAMTIRGIGMAAASGKWDRPRYDSLFAKLAEEASKITHPPSLGIAYTYIAMAQAFAGLDEEARKTASQMQNEALRNKAYGETAEIEAERGDLKNALASLAGIDTASYRNKAYDTVSRLFLEKAMIEESYVCASKIDNAYLRAKSVQRILNAGNREEEGMEPKENLKE
jgi:hypothetical protein